MPDLQPVQFGGLYSLDDDVLTPFDKAIDATNCYLDTRAITGRNGYRNAYSGAIGTGTVQGIWRYRPTPTSARTIVVQGGDVWSVADPSSETTTDATPTKIGTGTFGSSDNISGAMLGKYLYLASDNSSKPWVRVNSSFALETIYQLPTLTGATTSTTTPSQYGFFAHSGTDTASSTGGTLTSNYLSSGWYFLSNNANAYSLTWTFGAAKDFHACGWLLVFVSAHCRDSQGNYPIKITLNSASGSADIGTIQSTDLWTGANGMYCSLAGISSTILSAVTSISFTALHTGNTCIAVFGYTPIPARVGSGIQQYYLTYYNSSNGQESPLQLTPIQITLNPITLATYPNLYPVREDPYDYNSTANANPNPATNGANPQNIYNYRQESPIPGPAPADIVPFAQVNFTPTVTKGTGNGQADTIRVYKVTPNGTRLAASLTDWTTGTPYTWTDNIGDAANAQQAYIATGTPPPCTALCAVGGRLVAAGDPSNPNRVSVSSYLAFGQSGDPFPQFPAVPIDLKADGWQFDVSEGSGEQVICMVYGDALYIGTNERVISMNTLTPNSEYYPVYPCGVISRRSMVWAEASVDTAYWGTQSALFFCSQDGLYYTRNRAITSELTQEVRRIYGGSNAPASWFAPDNTTVLAYQNRKLLVIRGTRMLRYDFVTKTWTRHTLGHTMSHAAAWRDPSGNIKHLWYLESNGNIMRWQPDATSDAGSAISAWTYSTGFAAESNKARVGSIYADVTGGTLTVNAYKDTSTTGPNAKTFANSGEHELPTGPDYTGYKWRLVLTAANGVTARRVMWSRTLVPGAAGG